MATWKKRTGAVPLRTADLLAPHELVDKALPQLLLQPVVLLQLVLQLLGALLGLTEPLLHLTLRADVSRSVSIGEGSARVLKQWEYPCRMSVLEKGCVYLLPLPSFLQPALCYNYVGFRYGVATPVKIGCSI